MQNIRGTRVCPILMSNFSFYYFTSVAGITSVFSELGLLNRKLQNCFKKYQCNLTFNFNTCMYKGWATKTSPCTATFTSTHEYSNQKRLDLISSDSYCALGSDEDTPDLKDGTWCPHLVPWLLRKQFPQSLGIFLPDYMASLTTLIVISTALRASVLTHLESAWCRSTHKNYSNAFSHTHTTCNLLWIFVTSLLRWGVVSRTPNPQAGAPPLVGCPRLLIQYIRNYPPYLEAISSICKVKTLHTVVTRDPTNRISEGKPEGKRPPGRPRCRWVDNIKIDLREIG
jgi:hypothetical protein